MGVAASAASPLPEAAAPADPPAKEDIQPVAAADAPDDSPVKEEIEPSAAAAADAVDDDAEAAAETVVFDAGEEEQDECPFCVYMKGGGCKEEFVEWEKCVEEADVDGGNVVKRCGKVMAALGRCMENYPDYYTSVSCKVDRQFWEEDLPL
ncbi:uncharacterized protein LOC124696904 [Lolium rigidum]|uniref:uncharacterized protein LOC124696904 n=1 Tax=Lolium rigidum TaxID=89674 RepID=UPI001F5E24AF|nr:uncharacterized protein LOC124696904 [Lolium rigidum]